MKTVAAIMLCAVAMAAQAQTVHKCTLDGKVSYSDQPCPAGAGAAAVLDVQAWPAADPDTMQTMMFDDRCHIANDPQKDVRKILL